MQVVTELSFDHEDTHSNCKQVDCLRYPMRQNDGPEIAANGQIRETQHQTYEGGRQKRNGPLIGVAGAEEKCLTQYG